MANNIDYVGQLGLDESFKNIMEFETKLLNLHTFKEVQVKTEASNDWEGKFKGIWNESLDRLAGIVSKDYLFVQHKQAFFPLLKVLKDTGITKVEGRIGQDLRRAYMKVILKDERTTLKIKQPNGKYDTIYLSLVLKHGVDGSLALWGTVGAYRLVCKNGMIAPAKDYGTVRKVHRGQEQDLMVEVFYEDLIKILIDNSERISNIIEHAMAEKFKSHLAEAVLYGSGFGRNYIKKILEKCQKYDKMNKWQLYNSVTEYITHEVEKASFQKRIRYLNKANKILTGNLEELVKIGEELIPIRNDG